MSTPVAPAAVVTGATSGIGHAVAESLAASGHRVFICARTPDDVSSTVAQLRAQGWTAKGRAADVRSRDQVRSLVRSAVDAFDRVDVLVNNAGRSGGGVTAEISDELWESVVDTNLGGVFRTTREVLANGGILDSPAGRIINVASTAGKQGVPLGAPYSASKHGIVGFTKALGKELAPRGVTVNAVCPGYVETPMAETIRRRYAGHWGVGEDEVLARFQAKIPLGRYATAEEVAAMVAYLASGAAAATTAQALNVCGGLGNY